MSLPRCPDPVARKAGSGEWARTVLSPVAARPPAGGCPCGWVEHVAWRDPDAVKPEKGMLRLCRPAAPDSAGTEFHLDVHLPLRGVEERVHLLVPAAGPLAEVGTWRGSCDGMAMVGAGDRGTFLWEATCPELGAPRAMIETDGCHVRRVVRVGESEKP